VLTGLALQANYFQPLEDALLSVEANDSYTTLLRFYTTLLDRWSTHTLAHQEIATATSTMIQNLIDHGINLTLAVSQKESSQASQSAILSFYESLNAIFSNDFLISAIRITTPPSQLVYNLQFTSSLTTLNRLCAILASYKTALEAAIALKNTGSTTSKSMPTYSKAYLNHYNGYLMDICNCLWRGKALQTTDTNSLGCLIDANVTNALSKYVATTDSLTMPWLFSFSTSPMLCAFAITYMRGLEDRSEDNIEIRHAGPVTQASSRQLEVNGGLKLSWQDYRLGVLQYLESVGAAGVGSLMYNTMKHLMVARNQVS
jgi:centromere protein I